MQGMIWNLLWPIKYDIDNKKGNPMSNFNVGCGLFATS